MYSQNLPALSNQNPRAKDGAVIPRSHIRMWRLAFVIHMAFISTIALSAYMSWLPPLPSNPPGLDLLGHALFIGLAGMLSDGACGFRALSRAVPYIRLGPCVILAGAAIEELAQSWAPNRTASFGDFAADMIGVIVLSQIGNYLTTKNKKANAPPVPST